MLELRKKKKGGAGESLYGVLVEGVEETDCPNYGGTLKKKIVSPQGKP
jgi:hypothetical protein